MDARAWVHLAVMIVPVAILTVFNVLGMRPSPELAGALSALTTAAAVLTQVRRPQGRTAAKKVRVSERPAKKLQQRGAPARISLPLAEDDHRIP